MIMNFLHNLFIRRDIKSQGFFAGKILGEKAAFKKQYS